MLNSTRTALQSAGDATYNTALQQLYDLAWNTPGAKVTVLGSLIDTQPTSTAADRYDYVLAGLLTYLTATQSRNLVKQTLAQTLGMAPNVVALLIDSAMPAWAGPTVCCRPPSSHPRRQSTTSSAASSQPIPGRRRATP